MVEDSKAVMQRRGHSQQAQRNGKGADAMVTAVRHWALGRAAEVAEEGGVPMLVDLPTLAHTCTPKQGESLVWLCWRCWRQTKTGQDHDNNKTAPRWADAASRAEGEGTGWVELFWGSARVRSWQPA